MANLTDADKVLRNDVGKDIASKLTTIANAIQATQQSLGNLSDVNITDPQANDGLKYDADNDEWINGSVASSVGQLTDVDVTGASEGDSLVAKTVNNELEWQAKKLTVTLTQAEYDQLKLDGDLVEGTEYIITDGQNVTCNLGDLDDVTISGSPSGKVLMNNGSAWVDDYPCNYSETEHIVGTWIDGSTIYEKTIKYTSNLSHNNYTIIPHNISNFGEVISIDGWCKRQDGGRMPIPRFDSSFAGIVGFAAVSATDVTIWAGSNFQSTSVINKTFITLRYTKSA